MATYNSDQAVTLGLFALVDSAVGPASFRVLRRGLILDADGYEAPVFSPDGRFLAIRGNNYEQLLQVFEFPSLREVLGLSLGDPYPGYPAPPEWQERQRAWSSHNVAFALPGVLLVGTPDGAVLEIDFVRARTARHEVLSGQRVTAIAVAATGAVVVASSAGEVVVLADLIDHPVAAEGTGAAQAVVASFISTTAPVSEDEDLQEQLEMTDGTSTWTNEDLNTVTTAAPTDPMWLRLRAHLNSMPRLNR